MKIKIILLCDDDNSIHPVQLPWKDHSYEPWVAVFFENDDSFNYDLLHSDYLLRGSAIQNLFDKIVQRMTQGLVPKNNSDYMRFHKFKVYNELKREIKNLLRGKQGTCLEVADGAKRLGDWDIKNCEEDLENCIERIRKHEQISSE